MKEETAFDKFIKELMNNTTERFINEIKKFREEVKPTVSAIDVYDEMISVSIKVDSMTGKGLSVSKERLAEILIAEDKGVYNTVTDAANSIEMKITTLSMMLTGVNRNKTNLKYYIS